MKEEAQKPPHGERIRMMDSKVALQEAEKSLQETLAKLKETEKLEEKATKQS